MRAQEFLTEGLQYNKATRIIDKFIEFAASELELDELPDIDLQDGNAISVKHRSFGGYGNKHITVTLSNRHVNDVCRTIAHEMVHFKQDLNHELDGDNPGETGSPQENEANALAAVIMRKWGQKHPNLFAAPAIE